MASTPTKSKQETQVLYMPAVSVIVSGDRPYEHSSLTYTYATIPFAKPSLLARLFGTISSALTFVIAVFIFAIPVTVASLILIGSLSSSVAPAAQNQNVPGIEKVVPYVEHTESKVEPAR